MSDTPTTAAASALPAPSSVAELAEQAGISASKTAQLLAWAEEQFPGHGENVAAHELSHLIGARRNNHPYSADPSCPLLAL